MSELWALTAPEMGSAAACAPVHPIPSLRGAESCLCHGPNSSLKPRAVGGVCEGWDGAGKPTLQSVWL